MSPKSVFHSYISCGFALVMLVVLLILSGSPGMQEIAHRSTGVGQATTSNIVIAVPHKDPPIIMSGKTITRGLTITDAQTFTEGLTLSDGLTVTGELTVTQGLTVTGGLTVAGASLIVTGGLVVDKPVVRPGERITHTLTITTVKTFMRGLTVAGGLTVTNKLTVAGGLSVTGKVIISGTLILMGKRSTYHMYLPLISQVVLVVVTENDGFEHGPLLWDEFSTAGERLIRPVTTLGVLPHSGQWAAHLGTHNDEIALLSQGVLIPKEQSCLIYWQWTVSNDACNADYGGIGVNGYWVRPESLCSGTATGQWVRRQISMTHYSYNYTTTNIVLNFAVTNDYSIPSTLYVDDVAFYPTVQCAKNTQNTARSTESINDSAALMIGQPISMTQHTTSKRFTLDD